MKNQMSLYIQVSTMLNKQEKLQNILFHINKSLSTCTTIADLSDIPKAIGELSKHYRIDRDLFSGFNRFKPKEKMDMDKEILRNYVLDQNEKIIFSGGARVVQGKDTFSGRIHITPKRIIGLGGFSSIKRKTTVENKSEIAGKVLRGAFMGGIVGGVFGAVRTGAVVKQVPFEIKPKELSNINIQEYLVKNIPNPSGIGNYGFSFPLSNYSKVEHTNLYITWFSKVSYIQKGKEKQKKIEFAVNPQYKNPELKVKMIKAIKKVLN